MTDTANIKRQFLNSLKRGTGEAYLIVKNNPKIDFSSQIIKGVLNIYAYVGYRWERAEDKGQFSDCFLFLGIRQTGKSVVFGLFRSHTDINSPARVFSRKRKAIHEE